ncbi:unnamed protein product [Rangifer tarandus platyrhynchus]|uniref:Rab-GAP TBC domain-containing protein n=1 Tax=Rangifer tarandus platyrhynchus TaxID=3082113 RepID=A0ABN8Z4M9_RANTA|nr:unnamed protein product [Rangifer tarandus platyrhynchus]
MTSWRLPDIYRASVTHRHLCAVSSEGQFVMKLCMMGCQVIRELWFVALKEQGVSTIKKQLQLFRPACVLAKDLQNGRNSISLLPNFYLLLRRVVYITSAYHPRESDGGVPARYTLVFLYRRFYDPSKCLPPPNKILSEYNDVAEDL